MGEYGQLFNDNIFMKNRTEIRTKGIWSENLCRCCWNSCVSWSWCSCSYRSSRNLNVRSMNPCFIGTVNFIFYLVLGISSCFSCVIAIDCSSQGGTGMKAKRNYLLWRWELCWAVLRFLSYCLYSLRTTYFC